MLWAWRYVEIVERDLIVLAISYNLSILFTHCSSVQCTATRSALGYPISMTFDAACPKYALEEVVFQTFHLWTACARYHYSMLLYVCWCNNCTSVPSIVCLQWCCSRSRHRWCRRTTSVGGRCEDIILQWVWHGKKTSTVIKLTIRIADLWYDFFQRFQFTHHPCNSRVRTSARDENQT